MIDIRVNDKINKFIKKEHPKVRNTDTIKYINELKYNNSDKNGEIRETKDWKSREISYDRMQGRPSITLEIDGKKWDCLLDTGARVNVMAKDVAEKIQNIEIRPTEETLRCANDSNLSIVGKTTLEVSIGSQTENIRFIIVESITPKIIGGIELQKTFGMELHWRKQTDERSNEYICEIEARFGRNISDEERMNKAIATLGAKGNKKIYEIIERNKNVFMADNWDIGCTELITHHIKTNGGPILIKPRRQPVNLEEKIEEAIQNLWNNDVIKKCNSPWNTPLVCVWKKEKKDIRLCLDFRQLNQITERQAFPMPSIEGMLDSLHGAKYFSSIDLGNAYYQVKLDKESQEKTAFSTKSGQFCFTRMPFGIAAAPGTFQELMTKVLGDLKNEGTSVYLDDILIFTETVEEHYEVLEKVIRRIGQAGLRVNPDKCKLLRTEIKFLGHIINKQGIQTDPDKLKAIESFEKPKCIKNLRSFLGICNYYRRFIQDYAKKARNLEELCGRNKDKLIWTETCDKAFSEMKKALTTSPILAYPDFRKEFILDTDASFDTIGAVLSQKDEDGHEHVIAYGSHAMGAHEKGYCITRKELLAIYYFCQHFNHYLYGRRFTLRTDHKAITFMLTTKKPITAQFQTWINYLSSLDIDMKFRKGVLHTNADMLSRNTCDMCTQCLTQHEEAKKDKIKTRLLTLSEMTQKDWQNNEEIQKIKNDIRNSETKKYVLKDDQVFTLEGKIWIAEINKDEMIKQTHEMLCHAGSEKVWRYIQNTHDMLNMRQAVQDVINKCEACQKTKTMTQKTKEDCVRLSANEPFEKIYIDICGPWKETVNKQRYIIAIIDQFSKYISLTSISRQDENTIANVIQNKWILKYGAPKEIHVDCGKSFESRVIRDMAERSNIKIIFSSPYHHNTNGIVERQFRTIREYINATLKDKTKRNWAELLPEVEYTLNSTVQKTIGRTPAEIIFGRKINRLQWNSNGKVNREGIIEELQEKQDKYEKVGTKRMYNIGDKVMLKKEIRQKNDDKYEGPYMIIEKIHDRSYRLKDQSGKTVIRNIEKIKSF